jgi:hypothetical protein
MRGLSVFSDFTSRMGFFSRAALLSCCASICKATFALGQANGQEESS